MKRLLARYPLLKPTFYGSLGALVVPVALDLTLLLAVARATAPAFPREEAFSFLVTALLLIPVWSALLTAAFFIVWSALHMAGRLSFRNLHALGILTSLAMAIAVATGDYAGAPPNFRPVLGFAVFGLAVLSHIFGTGAARRALARPGLIGPDAWSTTPIRPAEVRLG